MDEFNRYFIVTRPDNKSAMIVNPGDDTITFTSYNAFSQKPGSKYRLFCQTSPISFSCGNLVPAIFRQAGNVTLIGQRTGGGSNGGLPATSASGTLFQISGNLQIATVRNGAFYNVDTGIEPHVRLNYPESFYDRESLVEMIHSLK